jgi:hypothetical protein
MEFRSRRLELESRREGGGAMPWKIDADAMASGQVGTNGFPVGAISQKSVKENEGDAGPFFEKDGFTTH